MGKDCMLVFLPTSDTFKGSCWSHGHTKVAFPCLSLMVVSDVADSSFNAFSLFMFDHVRTILLLFL